LGHLTVGLDRHCGARLFSVADDRYGFGRDIALLTGLGPRSKSVLLTPDLSLIEDKPIDFCLQAVCSTCQSMQRHPVRSDRGLRGGRIAR